MTTTSLIQHKPPPLKTRNDNPPVYLRTNNYYGSVGRPNHGRRKSAVELLQETKAFYVKSESVLDARQEFKNADHLHVGPRSPDNMPDSHIYVLAHSSHRDRGGPPPSAPPNLSNFPYATFTYSCSTCPPYPHEHLDHLHLMHTNYINSIKREKHHHHKHSTPKTVESNQPHKNSVAQSQKLNSEPKVTAKITVIDSSRTKALLEESWDRLDKDTIKALLKAEKKRNSASLGVRHGGKDAASNSSVSSHSQIGGGAIRKDLIAPTATAGTMTFTAFTQSGSLYSSLEKRTAPSTNSPNVTSKLLNGKGRERKNPSESDSPPPLPPKSPRTSSKPNRPSDFPQRLVQLSSALDPNNPNNALPPLPPPPPRKHTKSVSTGDMKSTRTVIRRSQTNDPVNQPMTLPSPILPPTPPPDVAMESPMSDSGPIISPPPAFSTPVTPMLDRQNSGVSDRSAKTFETPPPTNNSSAGSQHKPVTVSMSGVSSSSRSQSHTTAEDVSMRYSPLDRSRSRLSSSSPMSHQDMETSNSNGGGAVGRRASGSGSVFSSNVSMGQTQTASNSNSHSPSEAEESDDAISADVDGDDDDSSRAAEDHQSSMQQFLHVTSSKLNRNNSRKSAMSADGGSTQKRSPSRQRNGRKVSSSSSGRGNNNAITAINSGNPNGGSGKMPKSITENLLSQPRVSQANNGSSAVNNIPAPVTTTTTTTKGQEQASSANHYMECGQIQNQTQILTVQQSPKPRIVSPVRRPILRSKSDLSHRYQKASRSATLTPGFTLVHVDLGPPPVPIHNSVSTFDFHSGPANSGKTNPYQTPGAHHHNNSPANNTGNHYRQSQIYMNPTHHPTPHNYYTLQPSSTHYGHNGPAYLNSLVSHYQTAHSQQQSSLKQQSHYARPSSSTYENVVVNGKTELDRFFDDLGLESKQAIAFSTNSLQATTSTTKAVHTLGVKNKEDGKGGHESPVFFSSVSSIDSCARKSASAESEDSPIPPGKIVGARTVGAPGYSPPNNNGLGGNNNQSSGNNNNNGPSLVVHHGEPSIVERNARVIKWLFNCRKAMDNR